MTTDSRSDRFPRPARVFGVAVRAARRKACAIALILIIIAAASLSMYWVFLVPIFQSPDEPAHIDYALNIFSARRLIDVRESTFPWNVSALSVERLPIVWHRYTWYMMGVSESDRIAFHPRQKAPANYGTKGFFDDLDRNAPPEMSGDAERQPRVWDRPARYGYLAVYPFGYYALAAAWMRVVRAFSPRLSVLFFGARSLSVLLLICSLLLVYATSRELRLGRGRALLLTAIIGFFPLTSFVSSYVQPDNLCLTLAMLCFYLGLYFRRRPERTGALLMLGMSLGLLCATKYHVYLAVLLPLLGMVTADKLAGRLRHATWRRLALSLLTPSLAAVLIETWVTWGSNTAGLISNANTQHPEASQAAAGGAAAFLAYLVKGLVDAYSDFYISGTTFQSFWGQFGWLDTPLIIVSPAVNGLIRSLIAVLNCMIFGLAAVRVARVAVRLARIARAGRWRIALSAALSNPLINGYLLFASGLSLLYMVVRGSFAPQGRDWFPFILPIFLVATEYAPKAAPGRRVRAVLSNLIIAGLGLYSAVGSYYAIPSLWSRYYGP
jgi:4-amino-4-deoxy-L-arabinose transferase-like glycosyltransferase